MERGETAICFLFWAGSVLAQGSSPSLPLFDAKDLTPYWESEPARSPRVPATVGRFKALDQSGHAVTERILDGKNSLVNFFFARCGSVCPTMMVSLQKLQRDLKISGSTVRILSFSTQPEEDTPQMLKTYAQSHRLDLSSWSLLTGDRAVIEGLGRDVFHADSSGQTAGDKPAFIHSSLLYLVDAKRRIRGVYDALSPQQRAQLAQDLKHPIGDP